MDNREASVPQGQKRRAEDSLEDEQRFSKRFNLLNLEHTDKLYIPIQHSAPKREPRANGAADAMQLDDTKDKVYIYDLDDELSDIESEEEKLIFLPDIEKRLTKIPKSVLNSHEPSATSSEMVLYDVPTSLSVPEEQDNVRKAIIETRARARERQLQEAQGPQINGSVASGIGNGIQSGAANGDVNGQDYTSAAVDDEDVDAMDLG
ncbi:MAG: hypothetical protein FRX48_00364 [Lasallia pustulata]|uniref:Uncharacterized protein n=1 Tax=Lasallia pustulata TaxID=136370 RepID=A0A5M8Q0P7_9LECA|nr:MAG: hypothetical protein FRX48_00364 [Lasallia pustulata]